MPDVIVDVEFSWVMWLQAVDLIGLVDDIEIGSSFVDASVYETQVVAFFQCNLPFSLYLLLESVHTFWFFSIFIFTHFDSCFSMFICQKLLRQDLLWPALCRDKVFNLFDLGQRYFPKFIWWQGWLWDHLLDGTHWRLLRFSLLLRQLVDVTGLFFRSLKLHWLDCLQLLAE